MSTTYEQVFLDIQKLSFNEQLKFLKDLATLAEKNYTVKKKAQFGSAKGLIEIANDFDAPLEDFYLDKTRDERLSEKVKSVIEDEKCAKRKLQAFSVM